MIPCNECPSCEIALNLEQEPDPAQCHNAPQHAAEPHACIDDDFGKNGYCECECHFCERIVQNQLADRAEQAEYRRDVARYGSEYL